MLPPVVAVWTAIRILVEFVFPFPPLSKSQRRQLYEIPVIYTSLEEIWQCFFAFHNPKNFIISGSFQKLK